MRIGSQCVITINVDKWTYRVGFVNISDKCTKPFFFFIIIRETYQELIHCYLPSNNQTKWSSLFDLMESAREAFQIEEYSIKQTSLEQVFITMAKSVSNLGEMNSTAH